MNDVFTLSSSTLGSSESVSSDLVESLDLDEAVNSLSEKESKKTSNDGMGLYGGVHKAPTRTRIKFGSFMLQDTISKGTCGVLKSAVSGSNSKAVVVLKLVDKTKLSKKGIPTDQIYPEASLLFMKNQRHPNVIQVVKYKFSSTQVALVLEYLPPLNVISTIASTDRQFLDLSIQIIFVGLVSALEYIHKNGFVARNINHENILLPNNYEIGQGFWKPKLCGLSYLHPMSYGPPSSLVGCKIYCAPEMNFKDYNNKVDVYALGIVMHLLMIGQFPKLKDLEKSFEKNSKQWNEYGDEVKKMVQSLLSLDPNLRPSASELLRMEWLKTPGNRSLNYLKSELESTLKIISTSNNDQFQYVKNKTESIGLLSFLKNKSSSSEVTDSQGRVKVGEVGDHKKWDRNIKRVKVRGQSVSLIWSKNTYYAIANTCSHAGGPLDQGDIEDIDGSTCIKCPIHGFKFDVESGYTKTKKYHQKVFQVTIHDDKNKVSSIWLDI